MSLDGRHSEVVVERWLRGRGLVPERFPLRRRRLGKTPDFRVALPTGEAFLVEVKTLTNAQPGYGAVALKLARAEAQFDAVNQGGHLANVLALVVPSPEALRAPVADLVARADGPARALDLVLAFCAEARTVLGLHAPATSRHRAMLARTVEPVPAPAALGRTA